MYIYKYLFIYQRSSILLRCRDKVATALSSNYLHKSEKQIDKETDRTRISDLKEEA